MKRSIPPSRAFWCFSDVTIYHKLESKSLTRPNCTYVLQHGRALGDLFDNVVIKDCLNQDKERAVLGFDAELLCLEIDCNIVDFADSALLLGLAGDPVSELIVRRIATTFSILIVFIATKDKLLLEKRSLARRIV